MTDGTSDSPARATNGVQPLRWSGRLAGAAICMVSRAVGATLRLHVEDQSGLDAAAEPAPVIFCLWHNRLALSVTVFNRYFLRRHPQRKMAALVSASKDGAILSRALALSGVQAVRGSSSRRGAQALLELTTWAERGYDLAITPDGPRGPRYVVQPGPISLAQITGRAILPISAHIHWKHRLNSWDQFQIPLPFSRCDVRVGPALTVPRDADDAQREQLRLELERRMMSLAPD